MDNTVAPIQKNESKTYTAVSPTVSQMITIVLAFLLSNGLLSKPGSLVFFTDGARDLWRAIQDMFCFLPFKSKAVPASNSFQLPKVGAMQVS